MNDIEQLLSTLPRMSTPLNQNEGTGITNPQVLDIENFQLKNEFYTSFHDLEPSIGQALLKEVPKLKEWPHFSGEGEYDHIEFIKDIDMIKEDIELPDRLNMDTKVGLGRNPKLSTNGPMMLGGLKWKQPLNLPNLMLIRTKLYHGFAKKKDRLTALYPNMSEYMIHRKILRQCGGDLEHAVISRTTEQSSAEDIINILEEVTTRTTSGSSRVNLKTRFNTPWKDSVHKNAKENSNNKYKSADTVRKCHIWQSTTHIANTCPKRGKINEINIKKEPDVEKDNIIEEISDDKSSIFSKSSKDIENINATFDIMESYSHLPQLSNGQLDLSKVQDAQLMKTKPNRGKGYTAGNSCITEVVIENKLTKTFLDPGAFCSCVGKSFLKPCVPNFEDQLLPINGIKFNSASNPMKALGIFETNVIFPHINGNLRITVEFVVMENCSSTHFILGNDYLIMYGIDLHNNKDRYFTIGDNKHQKFAFLPFKRQITVNKVSPVNLQMEKFKSEQLKEAEISLHLTDKQENKLSSLLYDHRGAFASDKEPLGAIIGHEVDIILNIERPYPPLLRRPA
ncbi:hypothetical protein O181_094587 [Austropuccinia psidii MF-1]|uniref:Uncharacterized protein n=1 Tax=Austropuccinia psidii MF-1 TaxID=1389203 RepID=A0A9Q3PBN1_9BASI|nr:hypothetical protein [Austropuccinia psidii MF-1]